MQLNDINEIEMVKILPKLEVFNKILHLYY